MRSTALRSRSGEAPDFRPGYLTADPQHHRRGQGARTGAGIFHQIEQVERAVGRLVVLVLGAIVSLKGGSVQLGKVRTISVSAGQSSRHFTAQRYDYRHHGTRQLWRCGNCPRLLFIIGDGWEPSERGGLACAARRPRIQR